MVYILNNGQKITYQIAGNNCCVFDSYLFKKKALKIEFIKYLRAAYPEFRVRSVLSYYQEWKAHNILYKLHIKKASTKDSDLCITEYTWRKVGYFIISMFSIDI